MPAPPVQTDNPFPIGSLVDVRPDESRTWRAGTVVGLGSHAWHVLLDVPITQEQWIGVPNRYAPAGTLTRVSVFTPVDVVLPDQLLRLRS